MSILIWATPEKGNDRSHNKYLEDKDSRRLSIRKIARFRGGGNIGHQKIGHQKIGHQKIGHQKIGHQNIGHQKIGHPRK